MDPGDAAQEPEELGEQAPGDYSYDMAHDVPDALPPDAGPAPRAPAAPAPETSPEDPGGDYSYDLAHEVPRQQDL